MFLSLFKLSFLYFGGVFNNTFIPLVLVGYHGISFNYHADRATKWTGVELNIHKKSRSLKAHTTGQVP